MKSIVILATVFCAALVSSYPLPEGDRLQSEALNRLVMIEADNETALRSKRTIGILRELFPEASQMIEKKVNAIVAQFIRVLGPTLLQGALGNSGSSSDSDSGATAASSSNDDDDDDFNSTSSDGSKVSISLPTYPPDVENVAETLVSTSTEDNVTTTGGGQDRTTDMVNTVV